MPASPVTDWFGDLERKIAGNFTAFRQATLADINSLIPTK
jgi:hypothetical protein